MSSFKPSTGVILLLVVGIIAFLYLSSPPPETIAPPTDTSNWTKYTGSYVGEVSGLFIGSVGSRSLTRWENMAGAFEGTCKVQNTSSSCWFNVTGGSYVGLIPSGAVADMVSANLSGTASWEVRGYWKSYEQPQPAAGTDTTTILIVVGVGVAAYIITKYQKKERRILDNAAITELLRKHLREKWSVNLLEVLQFTPLPETGPAEQIRIHFLVDRPYKQSWLARYDSSSGNIDVMKRDCTWSNIEDYMTLKISYVEERPIKKNFEVKTGDVK